MKHPFSAAVVILSAAILVCQLSQAQRTRATANAPTAPQKALALIHVAVIDATGAPIQRNMTVVIIGDRIAAIAKTEKIRVPKGAQVVNATGKFLIPGLWDMHVHWYEKDYLPLFIANGVTGVRVMWGVPMHHEWRKEIEAGQLLGPRMVAIASTIVDGPKPLWPGSITAANAAGGRQAVIKAKAEGADFVKVYSFLPRDAFFAIADEARKQGIPFAGHVTVTVSAEEASNAGQRSIEHLTGILPACSSREADLLKESQAAFAKALASSPHMSGNWILWGASTREQTELALKTYSKKKAAALFALLKKNHTWQCPTLTVLRGFSHLDEPSFTNDPRLRYMPSDVRADWDSTANRFSKTRTSEDWAVSKKVFEKQLEIVGAMNRARVRILAGTDTLNPYCFPGFSLHDELALLVQAGLTPMQALQAATLNPARFLGKEKDFGTVAVGKVADVVLLDANPLDNIDNTRKISAVIFGGKLFPRAALDAMLAKIEALAGSRSTGEPNAAKN